MGTGAGPGTNHSGTSGLIAFFFLAQIQRLECSGQRFVILPSSLDHSHKINQIEEAEKQAQSTRSPFSSEFRTNVQTD